MEVVAVDEFDAKFLGIKSFCEIDTGESSTDYDDSFHSFAVIWTQKV